MGKIMSRFRISTKTKNYLYHIQTAAELPHECQYCYQSASNGDIQMHEAICAFKPVSCKYKWAGCTWNDRQGISLEHLQTCEAKSKPVHEAIALAHRDLDRVRSKRIHNEKILNLYTSNDCWYQDMCLKARVSRVYQLY